MRRVGRVHLRDGQVRAARLRDVVVGSVVRVGRAVSASDEAKAGAGDEERTGGVGEGVR